MNQLALTLQPPSVRSSRTSAAAADGIRSGSAKLRQQVLDLLRACPGGLTDEELQQRLGMNPSTERPRRVELVALGLVADSGRTGRTASGRSAVLWVAR